MSTNPRTRVTIDNHNLMSGNWDWKAFVLYCKQRLILLAEYHFERPIYSQ